MTVVVSVTKKTGVTKTKTSDPVFVFVVGKRRPQVFLFVLRKRRPCVSKKNCLPFNENFPAEKAYRLLESILATKYSRHKLFIDRTQEWFLVQNAFFVIRDFKQRELGRRPGPQALRENPNNNLRMTGGKKFDVLRSVPTWNESLWRWLKTWVLFFAFSAI